MRLTNVDELMKRCYEELKDDSLWHDKDTSKDYAEGFDEGERNIMVIIDESPTIDAVSVVKGTWKISKHNGDLQRYAVCDRCGYQYGAGIFNGFDCIGIKYYNFCPNCGAKMKGGGEE